MAFKAAEGSTITGIEVPVGGFAAGVPSESGDPSGWGAAGLESESSNSCSGARCSSETSEKRIPIPRKG